MRRFLHVVLALVAGVAALFIFLVVIAILRGGR